MNDSTKNFQQQVDLYHKQKKAPKVEMTEGQKRAMAFWQVAANITDIFGAQKVSDEISGVVSGIAELAVKTGAFTVNEAKRAFEFYSKKKNYSEKDNTELRKVLFPSSGKSLLNQ